MIVEIELVIHAHLAVQASDEERFVAGMLLHNYREGRAVGSDQSVQIADDIREEVVGDLGTAFYGDGTLVIMPTFMSNSTD